MKKLLVLAGIIAVIQSSQILGAQTLFTYGNYSADAQEFVKAFNKNNTVTAAERPKAMRDYLELYIDSRLKVREAHNRGYDTLSQIKTDIDNLRAQVVENYLNDPETAAKLEKEAFQRSQKDIHVAHIFIPFRDASENIDSAAADKKVTEAYQRLKKGEDFGKVARQYSGDPSVLTNNGDIGFVTVFVLPYEFENVVYSTPVGAYSAPYKSKIGFHIFKNLGERKAVGRMKAAQVLLAFPPGADAATKQRIAKLADSIYLRLQKGDDIAALSNRFSNDYVSAASGGVMPDFGVGQYDPQFEKAVFSLKKNGDVTRPFITSHGYHIVKRLGVLPVITDPNDKPGNEALRDKVIGSDRMQFARDATIQKTLKKLPVKQFSFSDKDLFAFADSALENKRPPAPLAVRGTTQLFSIGNQVFTAADFLTYAQSWRYKADGSGVKPYSQVLDEFRRHAAEDYYRAHLEEFNPEFKSQMNEFRDGNLFFEIMQREVWGKAQTDTVALAKYYQQSRSKYLWKESADAIIFFCSDETSGKALYDQVKKTPANWKALAAAFAEKVVTDSSRYELPQIPNPGKLALQAGTITAPLQNATDNSVSFAYVLKLYPANEPRNFNDAKGLVINDYQADLDREWIAELKKKYPVVIDEKVLAAISK